MPAEEGATLISGPEPKVLPEQVITFCALTDGGVYCWGRNLSHAVAVSEDEIVSTPTQVFIQPPEVIWV